MLGGLAPPRLLIGEFTPSSYQMLGGLTPPRLLVGEFTPSSIIHYSNGRARFTHPFLKWDTSPYSISQMEEIVLLTHFSNGTPLHIPFLKWKRSCYSPISQMGTPHNIKVNINVKNKTRSLTSKHNNTPTKFNTIYSYTSIFITINKHTRPGCRGLYIGSPAAFPPLLQPFRICLWMFIKTNI